VWSAWTAEGRQLREEAEHDHDEDELVRARQYVDGALVCAPAYVPDGSLASHREQAPPGPPSKR
jgi:hypothetical protein